MELPQITAELGSAFGVEGLGGGWKGDSACYVFLVQPLCAGTMQTAMSSGSPQM